MRCFLAGICLVIMLQGCAAMQLSTAELNSIRKLEVAQYQTPCLRKETVKSGAVALSGAVLFGAIGGGVTSAIAMGIEASEGKHLTEAFALPDFGSGVLESFVVELRKDFPGLPEPLVVQAAIDDDYKPSDSAYLLTIRIAYISLAEFYGLKVYTIGKMMNPKGAVVWKKEFEYRTSDFSKHSLEEFEVNNGKLLKQEMVNARDVTVSELLRHLKGLPSAVKRLPAEWKEPEDPAKK